MVTYRGYKTIILHDEETSYGAGSTPAEVIKGKIQTLNYDETNNLLRTLGLGEGRNETFHGLGLYGVTWSMEYEIADFDFLRYGVGSMQGSGTTVAPYYLQEEEFMDYTAGSDSGLKSFGLVANSLDVSGGTHDRNFLQGCVINNFSISCELGATVKVSCEGFARNVTPSATSDSFTPDTTKVWIYSQGQFKWDGTAIGRIQSVTLNFVNNFDPEIGREIGSRFVEAAEPGIRKYDWVLVVKMTDQVYDELYTAFRGQDGVAVSGIKDAELTGADFLLQFSEGAVSGDRNAYLQLEENRINNISKPINIGENIVEVTINGTGKRGTSNQPIKWWTVT